MYKTGCLILARIAKIFYIKIKNTKVKMGLIPRLRLGDVQYTGNALVKNRGGEAYIKILNIRDINEKIVAPEVKLEELDKIAISCLKNSSPCDKDIQTRAINIII